MEQINNQGQPIPNQSTSQSPVKSAPLKDKTFLIFAMVIGIILLILTAIILVISLSKPKPETLPTSLSQPTVVPTAMPTISETAGWKTYENEELGYEIKYPNDWEVDNVKDKNKVLICSTTGTPMMCFTIGNTELSIDSYIKQYDSDVYTHPTPLPNQTNYEIYSKITKREPIVISGVKGDKFSITNQEGPVNSIFISHNDNNFVISYWEKTIHDQILSSFKFKDGETTVSCESDQQCPNNFFCDISIPGGMTPNGVESGEPYGSQKCIQNCVSNVDCVSGKCTEFKIVRGDIVVRKMGCKE